LESAEAPAASAEWVKVGETGDTAYFVAPTTGTNIPSSATNRTILGYVCSR
jgi:hypothetical protein